MESQLPNFTSNIGANLVTALLFVAVWFLKNKCKHSRCDTNSACCSCHFDDYEDTAEIDCSKENGSKENDEIPLEVTERLQIVQC